MQGDVRETVVDSEGHRAESPDVAYVVLVALYLQGKIPGCFVFLGRWLRRQFVVEVNEAVFTLPGVVLLG